MPTIIRLSMLRNILPEAVTALVIISPETIELSSRCLFFLAYLVLLRLVWNQGILLWTIGDRSHQTFERTLVANSGGTCFGGTPVRNVPFRHRELSVWSKVKAILKKLKARTYKDLVDEIVQAMLGMLKEAIRNWFAHCCYCTS